MRILFSVLSFIFVFPVFCHAFQYEFARPAYDSGWHEIGQGEEKQFTHNLGGNVDDYVVDLQTRHPGLGLFQHNRHYGGQVRDGNTEGVRWYHLTSSDILASRGNHDDHCSQLRIRIWKMPRAHFDSDWQTYLSGYTKELTHNLGGNVDEYVVYMEFKLSNDKRHQQFYGGVVSANGPSPQHRGAQWAKLNASSISVSRLADDNTANPIRIRIWRAKHPDYDSGWQNISQGQTLELAHGINSPFSDFSVYLEFKDLDNSAGVNHVNFGGIEEIAYPSNGAYFKFLTGSTIKIFRNIGDVVADQVRVRIWQCKAPLYESSWLTIERDSTVVLEHGLLGSVTDDYIVTVESESSGVIGNRNIGGDTYHFGGDWKQEGVYWHHFNSKYISVHRNEDDIGSDRVRIRIWLPPLADMESGWIDADDTNLNPINFITLEGTSPKDYYVYIEGLDEQTIGSLGRNNRGIGKDGYYSLPPQNEPKSVGFWWHSLTDKSIKVEIGNTMWSDDVRVRIWKNGGKTRVATLDDPDEGPEIVVFWSTCVPGPCDPDPLVPETHTFDLQFEYNTDSKPTNVGIGLNKYRSLSTGGGIISQGAWWGVDSGNTIRVYCGKPNFSEIRLYAWDITWEPKQSFPVDTFPWELFLPAIINNRR